MAVVECAVPPASLLDPALVQAAYFKDAYSAPLHRTNRTMVDLFFDLFGHHPLWVKRVLIARNWLMSLFGLDVPLASEIMNMARRSSYRVGDKIGPWPIFALTETELIAGRDNSHLDFRLSILRDREGERPRIIVSTVCSVHNIFGKLYLFLIVPFHKWGVRRLVDNASEARRL